MWSLVDVVLVVRSWVEISMGLAIGGDGSTNVVEYGDLCGCGLWWMWFWW